MIIIAIALIAIGIASYFGVSYFDLWDDDDEKPKDDDVQGEIQDHEEQDRDVEEPGGRLRVGDDGKVYYLNDEGEWTEADVDIPEEAQQSPETEEFYGGTYEPPNSAASSAAPF